jgi:hypothetical protein
MKNNEMIKLIADIQTAYGCSKETVLYLFEKTNDMNSGAKYSKIGGYSSDVSEHSEIAEHLVILNFSYEQMKKDDKETLKNFNVNSVDINRFNYDNIDLNGMSLETYKNEVRNCLQVALTEINNPKQNERENNDIHINNILVFNTKTCRLSIKGQLQKKDITVVGEYKKEKNKPKTIAKKLIMKQANLRVSKYRRYCIDNMNEVKLQGEVLEIY